MRTERQTNRRVATRIRIVGIASLALFALASPAWADVAYPIGPEGGTCGLLGGAALSLGLTFAGCWVVRANRR